MKLTFSEIINKLKTIYTDVTQFAEYPYDITIPETYIFSEEYLKLKQDVKEWKDTNPSPIHSSCTKEEYNKYRNLSDNHYRNMPDYVKNFDSYTSEASEYLNSLGLEFKEIDNYGGEGKGETWWIIYYFNQQDSYIKVSGCYTSYNGVDFEGWSDSCSEVEPIQKTITVYQTKQ